MRITRRTILLGVAAAPFAARVSAGVAADNRATVRTLAGTGERGYSGDGGPADRAQLNNPFGVIVGPDGATYFCDTGNHCVRRIDRDGTIRTVAGTGKAGYAGDGGPATAARLNEPYEVRFSPAGDMYFVEMQNHLVRKVERNTGTISTVAGTGKPGFSGDGGPAAAAQFNQPHAIQFDPRGQFLYVCDIANHRLRRIELESGIMTTFAGDGSKRPTPDGGRVSPDLPLHGPRAIDFDAEDNLWLALREGNRVYRVDTKTHTVHHVAGTGTEGFSGNGGPARDAALSGPKGISIAPHGNVYLADTESHSIRMIDVKRGTIELIAGTGRKGDFAHPHGIFVRRDGVILVGDTENHRLRAITPAAR